MIANFRRQRTDFLSLSPVNTTDTPLAIANSAIDYPTYIAMVFGIQDLKNELEAVKEERDFFQSKYLEQMEELKELRKAVQASQRQITRLRKQIIDASPRNADERRDTCDAEHADAAVIVVEEDNKGTPDRATRMRQVHLPKELLYPSAEDVSDEDEDTDGEDMDENAAIRECASKLLEWVDHRDQSP